MRQCANCNGTGRIRTYNASNTGTLAMGGYTAGTLSGADSDCQECVRGFRFSFIDTAQLMQKLLTDVLAYLEDPKNAGDRTRFLNLYITDIEIKMGAGNADK
jgi:hypothetical protein